MPVNCILRKTTGVLKDKDAYYVEALNYSLIDSDAFMQHLEQNFRVPAGEVFGTVYSMVKQMVAFLQNGHRVEVQGLGTFAIKMKGDVVRDGDGVLQLKNAQYAGIQFTPDKTFTRQMRKTKFELISHEAPLIYSQVDEEQAMEFARELCNARGSFLIQEFRNKVQSSYSYARKVLNGLVNKGMLVKNSGQYSLPQ